MKKSLLISITIIIGTTFIGCSNTEIAKQNKPGIEIENYQETDLLQPQIEQPVVEDEENNSNEIYKIESGINIEESTNEYDYSDYSIIEEEAEEVNELEVDNTLSIMGIDECRIKLSQKISCEEYDLTYIGMITDPINGTFVETFANTGDTIETSDFIYGIISNTNEQGDINYKKIFSDGTMVNYYNNGTDEEIGLISEMDLKMIIEKMNSL